MADVQGNRHHGNEDRGSPVKIGGKAVTSTPTDVDDGDRVDAYFDTKGRLVIWAQAEDGGDIAGGSGGGDGAINDGVSSAIQATVLDYTNSNPLAVRLSDTAGDYVGAGAGTQYTEDAAAAANPTGTAPILVRKDTPAATVTTDGDNVAQRGTNYGAAYVQVVSSAGAFVDTFGGGTQYTEGDTDASITGTAMLWEDGSDTLRAASAAKPLPVDVQNIVTVTAATSTHQEDDAHADEDDGTFLLAVRNDSAATTFTDANGDYSPISVDDKGRVGISDQGGSITVDLASTTVTGTVAVTQSGTWDEVGIHDSGNSITVDGTVTANLAAGTNNIGDVDVLSIAAGDNNIGNVDIVTLPSIPAGTNNIGDVDVLTLPGVGGLAAHASATSGNPVYVAGRASTAVPTDVGADGDAAGIWTNRNGAPVQTMAPHVGLIGSPWDLVHEAAQYTTTQTSTVLVAGGASEKIVVTKVQIQVGGTTAGTLQLYFGTGAYSRGTSRALFDGEFAPSATLKPGVVMDGPFIAGTNGDDLMVTTSAAINPLTISTWYYLVT